MIPEFLTPTHPTIDPVDLHILEVLLTDARASVQHVSDRVGLAVPTVTNRIEALENYGVIEGYVTRVNYEVLGFPIAVTFQICVHRDVDHVSAQLSRYPTMTDVLSVTGRNDVLAVGHVSDLQAVRVLDRELSALSGVDRVTTNLVLEPYMRNRPIRRLPDELSVSE